VQFSLIPQSHCSPRSTTELPQLVPTADFVIFGILFKQATVPDVNMRIKAAREQFDHSGSTAGLKRIKIYHFLSDIYIRCGSMRLYQMWGDLGESQLQHQIDLGRSVCSLR